MHTSVAAASDGAWLQAGSLLTFRATLPSPNTIGRARAVLDQLLGRIAGRAGTRVCGLRQLRAAVRGLQRHDWPRFPDRPPCGAWAASRPVGVMWASSRYFETLGIRLVRGRVSASVIGRVNQVRHRQGRRARILARPGREAIRFGH